MKNTTTHPNKYALITGAADGIGKALAIELAGKGYSILAIDKNSSGLQLLETRLQQTYSVTCYIYVVDLSQPEAVNKLLQELLHQDFNIEVLINNAGILLFESITELSSDKINTLLELHIKTVVLFCAAIGKKMKQAKRGYILNISSISAVMPYPGISLYGPSKSFIRSFSKALRLELMSDGVYVTCLIPGATATSLYDPTKVDMQKALRWGIMKSPEFVAHKAIHDLFENKSESVHGWINRMILWICPLIPSFVIKGLYSKTNLMQDLKNRLPH